MSTTSGKAVYEYISETGLGDGVYRVTRRVVSSGEVQVLYRYRYNDGRARWRVLGYERDGYTPEVVDAFREGWHVERCKAAGRPIGSQRTRAVKPSADLESDIRAMARGNRPTAGSHWEPGDSLTWERRGDETRLVARIDGVSWVVPPAEWHGQDRYVRGLRRMIERGELTRARAGDVGELI